MCLAIPAKIETIDGKTGLVALDGNRIEVVLSLVPEAKVGDYALVHAGFAISIVDETEAQQTLEYFRQMGDLAELQEAENAEKKA